MISEFLSHRLVKQILRFGVVGGLAFGVDFGLLVLLTEVIGWNYLISATCSFLVSCLFNYILSVVWVFDSVSQVHGWKRVWQICIFVGLSSIGLGLNNIIMWLTVEVFMESYILGKLIATVIVMFFNFVTRKIMLERKQRSE